MVKKSKVILLISCLAVCILGVGRIKFTENVIPTSVGILYKTIVIDPGHGGFDPGKPGINGKDEKVLNLKIALKLKKYLEDANVKVIMTRTTDEDVDGMDGVKHKSKDMVARKKIAEAGDVLVSIHQNSFTQQSVRGAQVFYSKDSKKGKKLAEIVQKSIKDVADESNKRSAKSNTHYYVLREVSIPSIIVECGFLTNFEEEKLLNDEAYQDKIANAIYLGICKYFTEIEQGTI